MCNTIHIKHYTFCPECGCNLTEIEAVSVNINSEENSESLNTSIRSRVQEFGKVAQRGLSDVSNIISKKAGEVSLKATNVVVEDKVSEAMGNLVNLMIMI